MRWIATGALAGWLGIVWLAYVLAEQRMAACGYSPFYDRACALRVTTARDNILIGGLTIGLLAVIALAYLWVRHDRLKRRSAAQPEATPEQPRPQRPARIAAPRP